MPIPKDAKSNPNSHSFLHAIHHPDRIRPEYEWVDWFTRFKADDRGKTVGLEFQEGLWAEKLALIAIAITIAIIIVSIVWVVKGGQLQTVFTVMGFVLSGAAGEFALNATMGRWADMGYSRGGTGCAVLPSYPLELRMEGPTRKRNEYIHRRAMLVISVQANLLEIISW